MASIYSSIYEDVVADVLHQAANDGFNTSSDELDRRPIATGALAAMLVGRNKLQAFQLREFAAKGKPVKVKAMSKLSDAKKAAPKDTAKSKKKAAADKVAIAGLAVAWCLVFGLILFNSLRRNQQAAMGPSSAGDGAAGGGVGISSSDFPSSTKLQHLPMDRIRDLGWCSCGPSWGPRPAQQSPPPLRGTHARSLGVHPFRLVRHATRNITFLIFRWRGLHAWQAYYYSILAKQPLVMLLRSSTRWLLFWFRFVEAASTWDPGLSFVFVLRRRLQQHPSVAGVLLQCWLLRPNFNLRFARSIHPGACVHDAPATLRMRTRLYQSRRFSYLSFQLQDFNVNVIWFSSEDLLVMRLQ